jgi:Cu2+-exporting ATPase
MNAILRTAADPDPEATTCFHCGLPLPPDAASSAGRAVCCAGCAAAAAWIEASGLDDYYRLRTLPGNRIEAVDADLSAWDRPELQSGHVHDAPEGGRAVTLALEGLRCAACAWLVDRALSSEPGVEHVSVNAVTGRLTLRWDPALTRLSVPVARLAALGYRAHLAQGTALEAARRRERIGSLLRLGVAALVATQAMMFSEALYFDFDGRMSVPTRDLFRWLAFALTTPVVFWCGWPLLVGMVRELRARAPGMDALAGGAILLAYAASVVETLRGGPQVWFDAAAMFVLFLLAARLLESFARQRAAAQLDLLARAQPVLACREGDGSREWVASTALEAGDIAFVPADEAVPADGVLLDASARLEEALLTGESTPVLRQPGDRVLAGSVCRDRSLRIRVTAAGTATRLSALGARVAAAQAQRPPLAQLADRLANRFALALFLVAALAFGAWLWIDAARAFPVALAVLVAACPCALSLATPAALSAASSALVRAGVLVVGPEALSRLACVDTVVFDKTGTLTTACASPSGVRCTGAITPERALAVAAGLERESGHPLASAFAGIDAVPARDVRHLPGQGLEGSVDGATWRLGHARFAGLHEDDTALWLAREGVPMARIAIRHVPRPGAAQVVADLHDAGLYVLVLSGDNEDAVSATCLELGIRSWRARQSPADKLAAVRERQAAGYTVLAIGDGSNDAPLLAGADVSIALAGGLPLAHRAADLLLLGDDIRRIPGTLALARATGRTIAQNLAWAVAYNLVAVGAAAAGALPPAWAAAGMVASSLGVTLNALRLGRRRP